MGLKSGEWGNKNTTCVPIDSISSLTFVTLWVGKLSMTTQAPGYSYGISTSVLSVRKAMVGILTLTPIFLCKWALMFL